MVCQSHEFVDDHVKTKAGSEESRTKQEDEGTHGSQSESVESMRDERKYTDAEGENVGHGRPAIDEAISDAGSFVESKENWRGVGCSSRSIRDIMGISFLKLRCVWSYKSRNI